MPLVEACPSSASAFVAAPSELAVIVDVLVTLVDELDSLVVAPSTVVESFDEREKELEKSRRKWVVGKVLLD